MINSHDPSSRSRVLRVGSIRPVMNRECAATITNTGSNTDVPSSSGGLLVSAAFPTLRIRVVGVSVPNESPLLGPFVGLPEHVEDQLLALAVTRRFNKGQLLFNRDDAADEVMIIQDGLVAVHEVTDQVLEATLYSQATRLRRALARLHHHYPNGHIEVTHEMLAEMLAIPRTTVSELLADEEAAGRILRGRGSVRVFDPAALRIVS